MSNISIEQTISQALNTFIFHNVWNESPSEYRTNIIPNMYQKHSVNGSIRLFGKTIFLPTNKDPYFVFLLTPKSTHGLSVKNLPVEEWIDTERLCNEFDILFHFYHISGKMLSKKYTYIYSLPYQNGYIVAVNKTMFNYHLNVSDLWMDNIETGTKESAMRATIYYDSDITNKITVASYKIPFRDTAYKDRQAIIDFLEAHDKTKITMFKDGYQFTVVNRSSIPDNCYVDLIYDENIVFTFDVDLTDQNVNYTFLSDKDETYKQIVHTPKEYNPNNELYTHNTMEIYVIDKNNSDKGLYLHRCAKNSVTQITHNDVAIPTYILNAYRDSLETQDIKLHITVRKHNKDNVLIRDKSYIDMLYALDDNAILQHLAGRISEDLYFWKASELEKTKYVESMFDVLNIVTPENLFDYVEGLGYYHVLALLTKRLTHTKVTDAYRGSLNYSKPYLYQNYNIYPLVYLNGKKINNKYITYNNYDPSYVSINTSKIGTTIGDIISVEMLVDDNTRCYKIEVNEDNRAISIPYSDFTLIEERKMTGTAKGINHSSNYYYIEFTEYTNNILIDKDENLEGFTKIYFNSTMYDKTILIQPKRSVYRFNKNLDEDIKNGKPLTETIETYIYNDENYHLVPIWYTPSLRVYLNGRYLTEGIDYKVETFNSFEGNLSFKQLVIYNYEYLKEKDNVLEYFVTSAEIENDTNGFNINNKLYSDTELALLFENITTVHVDGYLENNVISKGNYLSIPSDKYREGAIFSTVTSIPSIMKEYLDKYHPNDDLDRLKIITDYFYGKTPEEPNLIVLDNSHKLYSIYTSLIIYDILNGKFEISYDPDIARIVSQFKDYEYIRRLDITLNKESDVDIKFCDIYPHYRELNVENIETYRTIQTYLDYILTEDNYSNDSIVYTKI